jgi:ceramide glucosyltransferase
MSLHSLTSVAGLAILSATAVYAILTLIASVVFRLRRAPAINELRAVSVLKPLCGNEPALYANLRSFCTQDYPCFELVFGVRDPDDPALATVARLRREFPALQIRVAVESEPGGVNRKVSNLVNMLPHTSHDLILVADSDTRVEKGYLRAVLAPLTDARNGLVTCVYHRVPATGFWSLLGAMYINDWYTPCVMLAWLFGDRRYVSGQTIAMRRETLAAIGGFDGVASHLADDYQLGDNVRRLGLRVVLSPYVPCTVQSEPTFAALSAHELRWMRTLRTLAPGAFRFLCVSFTLPLLLIGLALTGLHPSETALILAGLTLTGRLGVAALARLTRPASLWEMLLLPLRDGVLFWTWSRAFFTSRVSWRGSEFEVDPQGMMRAIR